MFQEFASNKALALTTGEVLGNILIALICGLAVSAIYRWTYKGPGYSVSFVNALVLLAMITAVAIMVIGNNIARAFGLVGVMSIIRFRTAVKDTQDIVFIFFSMATGMAAGIGMPQIAIPSTIFIGLVILVLSRIRYGAEKKREYLLQFYYTPDSEDQAHYIASMEKFCRDHKLINAKAYNDGASLELSFYVHLKDKKKSQEFIRELDKTAGVSNVNLYYDDEMI